MANEEKLRMIRTIWRELERQSQSAEMDSLYLHGEEFDSNGVIIKVGVDNKLNIEQLAEAIINERR